MSVLQTMNQFGSTVKRKELEDELLSSSYLNQSMFPQTREKDGLTHSLYSSVAPGKPQSSFLPSMTGLTSGFQGLSVHPSVTRGLSSNAPFSRSNTVPSGFSNIGSNMMSMTGMSQFGAPSPPPARNNMFLNSIPSPMNTQGLGGIGTKHTISRPNTLASAINSGLPVNSYGGLGSTGRLSHMTPFGSSGFGSSLSDVTGQNFDPSDFPVLGTRTPESGFSSAGLSSRSGYGQLNKVSTESPQEFQMRSEDFPSLPGSSTKSIETSESIQDPTYTSSSSNVIPENRSSLSYDPAPGSNKERSTVTAIGTSKPSTRKRVNVPPSMVQDHYGMMGLLTFIRGAETDPNLVALALGSDLTTLGLNLNSPESLYSTFSSPFADSPSRPQDIDYAVPQEYLIHSYIRDKLAPIRLSKYNEDLLFYLYYTSGGDLLQLLAAHELYSRDWRYHKEERVWITRAPGMRPTKVENMHEEGTYCFFDVTTWRKCHKDMKVEYDKLAERPHIPSSFTSQQIVSSVPMNA